MQSVISHFFKKKSKRKHDEHEEHSEGSCSSNINSVGTLDDSRIIGIDSAQQKSTPGPASGLVSITECFVVNQVVEATLIHCVHHGYSSEKLKY